MRKFFIFYICLVIFILYENPKDTFASETILKMIPSTSFLKADNMAPGDKVSSSLKLVNPDRRFSSILIKTRIQSGSNLFFKHLQLKVVMDKKLLYQGPLSNFQDFKIKFPAESKQFLFTIQFPKDSSNEYQGLQTMVAFDFFAASSFKQDSLPITATNQFNLLAIGIFLIIIGSLLFHFQSNKK